jgi:hypothetical protein
MRCPCRNTKKFITGPPEQFPYIREPEVLRGFIRAVKSYRITGHAT